MAQKRIMKEYLEWQQGEGLETIRAPPNARVRILCNNNSLSNNDDEFDSQKQAVIQEILRTPPTAKPTIEPTPLVDVVSNTFILPLVEKMASSSSSSNNNAKKKQIHDFLKHEAQLLHQIQNFELLHVRDESDAERKLLNLKSLRRRNGGVVIIVDVLEEEEEEDCSSIKISFPFLYVQLQPPMSSDGGSGSVGVDLCRRLIEDIGCVPVGDLTQGMKEDGTRPPSRPETQITTTTTTMRRRPFVYDMETSDPDDVLTLLYLLSSPLVDLKLVTINPGTRDQVGLVYSILEDSGRQNDILIGSGIHPFKPKKEKNVVDAWYKTHFRSWVPRDADGSAASLLYQHCDGDTTVVTGGRWTNLLYATDYKGGFEAGTLVAQGGFASASVCGNIPQLEQFQGLEYKSSYNMNANPRAVYKIASYQGISTIKLVSKNVCHREIFDQAMLEDFPPDDQLPHGLKEIKRIMTEAYFDTTSLNPNPSISDHKMLVPSDVIKNDGNDDIQLPKKEEEEEEEPYHPGKKIHDILAAACAISPEIATWRQVEITGKAGTWGTKLSSNSHIFITVDYDSNKFQRVFFGTS